MPGPAFPRRLLFTAVTVVGVLLGLEGLGRLRGRPPELPALALLDTGARYPAYTRYDPVLGWRQAPGARGADPIWAAWAARWGVPDEGRGAVRTNDRGFRDAPLVEPRPAGRRRVMVLGDSSVWGSGVPAELRFSERLEGLLAPRDLAVINAGVPGYSTWQALAVLRESADLGLDGVILYTLVSDTGAVVGPGDDLWFSSPSRQRGSLLFRHSALYVWLRHGVFTLRARTLRQRDPTPRNRVHVRQYQDNIAALVAEARRQGAFVVGVVPPVRTDVHPTAAEDGRPYMPVDAAGRDRYAAELAALADQPSGAATLPDYRRALVLALEAAGAPVVDGPLALIQARNADPARFQGAGELFADAVHPALEGHRVLAEALAPVLAAELDALPADRGGR